MNLKSLLVGFVSIFIVSTAVGQIVSANDGAWTTGATWVGGIPPAAGDVVVINDTHDITYNTTVVVASLTMNGVSSLTMGGGSLTTGSLTINGSLVTISGTGAMVVSGAFGIPASGVCVLGGITFTCNGATSISGYFSFAISATGTKTFNNTIEVLPGGTFDNIIGENVTVNCNIVNRGNWPAPTGGGGVFNVTTNGASYSYLGPKVINMNELNLTSATGTTITNYGFLQLNGTGNVLNVATGRTFRNGDPSGTAAVLYIGGSGVIAGVGTIDFAQPGNTVDYMASANQPVRSTNYSNLKTSGSGTKTLGVGTTTVTTSVTTAGSAIFDVTTRTLSGAANLIMTGTSTISFAKTGVTLPELTGTANLFDAGTTVRFDGADVQTAKPGSATNPSTTNSYPYQTISISGTNPLSAVDMSGVPLVRENLLFTNMGTMTGNPVMTIGGLFSFSPNTSLSLSNDITIGSFLISNGTLNYSTKVITVNGINGTWTNNGGGTFINGNSRVIFTGGTNQQITGTASTSFANLEINNPNDLTLNGVDAAVTSSLILTTGRVITGANNIYIPLGGTVTRGTGFVQGNLKKDLDISASTPLSFEIGSGTKYTPIDAVFTSVSVTGFITAFTTDGDHPGIASSNIEPSKTANRYWTLRNSGATFASYEATLRFDPTDLDGAANPLTFIGKGTRNSGISWISPTVGTRTATSTQISGLPGTTLPTGGRIDFQVGEAVLTTGLLNRITGTVGLLWSDKATWIENRTGTATFNSGSTAVSGSGTLFLSELADGDIIMLQTSSGTVQGTVASRTDDTNLILTTNAATNGTGGYGRQRVPNLASDVVTIGNASIAVDAATTVTYDMPSATTINTLYINTATSPRATAQTLTHSSATLLTVTANVEINQPAANGTDSWNIDAGTAAAPGTVTIGSLINNNLSIANIRITTGTLSAGSFLYNTLANAGNEATAAVNITGLGTINFAGLFSFANSLGTLNPGTASTFNFNGSGPQLLVFPTNSPTTFKFFNLTFNNSSSSGVLVSPSGTLITAANVLGNLRIQSGVLVTSDNTTITGNAARTFQIDPGATLRMTGNGSTFPTVFGTFNLGIVAPFGTVKFEQTNATTIPARSYGNLQALYPGTTYSLSATGSVAGNLTVGLGTNPPVAAVTLRGTNTTAFAVTGDVIINKNAILDALVNGRIRNFTVGGNWTNNGTFTPSTNAADILTFNGTGPSQPQVISGTATESFTRVSINSPIAGLVRLDKTVTITNVLTLTQGGIDLNGNMLSVTSAAPTAIVRTGGYVKSEKTTAPYGQLRWTHGTTTGAYTYPFGKSSSEYIPVIYNITTAGSTGSTMSIATYATPPNNTPLPTGVLNLNGTSGGNSVVDRFWVLTPSTNATKPIVSLTLTAVGGSAPVTTPPSERPGTIADLTVLSTSPAGITGQSWSSSNYWNAPTAGQTFANDAPAVGFFQTTMVLQLIQNNPMPYALTDAAQPLPIKLIDFTAVSRPAFVELNWRTETEIQNDFFTVQKSDGIEGFADVVKVTGAGNSTSTKNYSAFDYHTSPGKWYYRLRQTDYDGNFTYSKIISVDILEGLRGVYPNPSNGTEFNFSFFQNDIGNDILIKVQDISGKELSQFIVEDLQSKQLKLEFSQKLPSGIYIVSIITGQEIVRQKVVVK